MNETIRLPKNVKHIHLVGIGGVGVSALAPVLLDRGFSVSGSDPAQNAITDRLEALGVPIYHHHEAAHVKNASLVVVSSAIQASNPEWVEAKRRKIPVWHRAQMLGWLLQDHKSLVVTGAHGKTTVTAMVAQLLSDFEWDPTALIGGDVRAFGSNVRVGKGEWMVAEGDESDGSFLYLHPDVALINNIDADHLDHYPNLDAIIECFCRFLGGVKSEGWVLVSADCEHSRNLARQTGRSTMTYGFSEEAEVRGVDYRQNGDGGRCEVLIRGKKIGVLRLRLNGSVNYHNALAAMAVADILNIPFERAMDSLSRFEGVRRRMEVKGAARGVTVIDDYAHHPTEIRATLEALRERIPGRLIGVFQPHLYSRTLKLLEEFGQSFGKLDLLVVADIYPAREEPQPGVTGERLVSVLRRNDVPVIYIPSIQEIPVFLRDVAQPGDSVITLGAGNVWQVGEQFLELESKRPGPAV